MTKKEDILDFVGWKKSKGAQDPIFVVYMVQNANKEMILRDGRPSGFPDFGHCENVGFYYDIDSAIHALETNSCDIREYLYDAGFVLCRFPGLYESAIPKERMFFVWNEEQGGFTQAEESPFMLHVAL